jgi:hypothetical protein
MDEFVTFKEFADEEHFIEFTQFLREQIFDFKQKSAMEPSTQ